MHKYTFVFAVITWICIIPVYLSKDEELQIIKQFVPEDCSEVAESGDDIEVHYTGTLQATGQPFDSSRQPGRGPLPFKLGTGKVIPGWEQGIQGMCVGEKRQLIIPHHLAYGEKGHPPAIPPKATLVFDTELVSVKKAARDPMVSIDSILPTLQTLAIPAVIIYMIYYLYKKYNEESGSAKVAKQERKEERRTKKKRN